MKYEYLKLTQIITLSLTAIHQQSVIIYISTLLLALLTHQKHWTASIISTILISLTLIQSIEIWKLALIVVMALIGVMGTKFGLTQPLSVTYLLPVFLLAISLTSINDNQLLRIFQLVIFLYLLLLTYYAHQSKYKFSLLVVNVILFVEGVLFSLQHFLQLEQFKQSSLILSQNLSWWYFLLFPFCIQCSSFIIQSLNEVNNEEEKFSFDENLQKNQDQQVQIELTDFRGPKSQKSQKHSSNNKVEIDDYFKNIQFHTDNIHSQKINYKQPPQQNIPRSGPHTETQSKENNFKDDILKRHQKSDQKQSQSQSLNMILVLPFLAQNAGALQLPIYLYMFSIHYQRQSSILYLFMLLTNFAIIFLLKEDPQDTLDKSILLRMAIVLLVNKNIHVLSQVTEIVKKIWLRSSFVVVLAFLFWFSLKTVNVFHIILTIILLIFISARNEKNQYSYRHKYWIYLLTFFNAFLFLREIYHLLIFYNLYSPTQSSNLQNILDLAGISHQYQTQSKYFNLIPGIVSVFLGFQYLTYESVIYNFVRQRPILPIYETKINQLVKLLTIIYYKLIPWLSYVFIIFVILALEFSCTSFILLVWLLISLSVQVQRKNCLRTYQILYNLWSVVERLFAIEIILRYSFQFLNFPIFDSYLKKIPFFSVISQYKQFLGLAIRQGDYVYFKAITKFQMMVGLDFICIFISFLVIEYYTYLIAYHEIESHNFQNISVGKFIEKDSIKEIYSQFINFKLTVYFKKFTVLLKRGSKVIVWVYYPFLGIYCCIFPSLITFLLLLVAIRFYVVKNSQNYDKFIRENLILKVKQLFKQWKQQSSGNRLYKSASYIYEIMTSGKKTIRFNELIDFQNLRKYILLVSSLGVILNYTSRVFDLDEYTTLFGIENTHIILKIRWIFYISGVSIHSSIEMIHLLIIIGSTIIQVKCTRFLLRLYDLSSRNYEQQQNDMKIKRSRLEEKNDYGELSDSRYLYVSLMEQDKEKEKQLRRQMEQIQELEDTVFNQALKKHIQRLRDDAQDDQPIQPIMRQHSTTNPKPRKRAHLLSLAQLRQSSAIQLRVTKSDLKKFIQMKVSLLQGMTKFIERCFVMVLVFLSIIQNRHPFGIVYLICSMVLTFLGAYSILSLSRVIAMLVGLEYMLVLCNYANYNIVDSGLNEFKEQFQTQNTFDFLTSSIPKQWQVYLTFGDTQSQTIMMILSWVLLFSYQLYFQFLTTSWSKILDSLSKKLSLSKIQKKIYQYSNLIYTYFLIYSPLCITICSLGIYLLDFTITNLFLTIVSILFLFKSVLVEEYSGSRQFWRLYFYVLQFFIVVFMLIYDVLSIPMYQQYCVKILCSDEQFHTKVYKAGLLFVLQIGIDLTKSSYFISALDNLKLALSQQVTFSKLAIAYKQNDRKINKKFKQLNGQRDLEQHLQQVEIFLGKYRSQPDVIYQNKQQITLNSQSWIDVLLQILPSFVDSTLVLTSQQAREFVTSQNQSWLKYCQIDTNQLQSITEHYLNQFGEIEHYQLLMEKINYVKNKIQQDAGLGKIDEKGLENIDKSIIYSASEMNFMSRKSFSENKLPYEAEQYCRQRLQEMRQSLVALNYNNNNKQTRMIQQMKQIENKQKQKLLFLLFLQSTISNWHYLTYFFLILQHIVNMGLLTLPFPIFAFCYGLIYNYQAPKNIWRINFLFILLPISFKFSIAIGLLDELNNQWIHLLIGDHPQSIWLEYIVIMFVLVECLILKIIGLYDQGVTEVQCMKMALIRNIVNCDNPKDVTLLAQLLKQSLTIPQKTVQFIFGRSQQKAGYSYTTLMTSLQLSSLFFVFFFYDQMAIRKQMTIYQMISYNQFTAGMVILTLIQLGFILIQRFINITDFKQHFQSWQFNLILKYIFLIINLIYTELLILVFFPFNSNNFTENKYVAIYYVINALVFLVSALQIKYGIDQKSKGFMDRYTWYNGFVYMGFRAVPFLFEFKVFSDWTFTKTALRLFDWIKLEEIFGRMYIAKCNSIFLRGKVLGSKIQWWKKLLMGFPLLFAIILLIFGPLILFSNLNPLASTNSISAGYLELGLKVNHTNQYVFYTNSHITDIVKLIPNQQEKDILSSYDIDQDTVQVINLEQYSDQYWEISQGSYLKLLDEPEGSLYQIVIRMKFQRNQTGSTPTYTVNTYEIPQQQIPNFKNTLQGKSSMILPNFLNNFLRLDNNNGIHLLDEEKLTLKFYAQQAKKSSNKKYWIIQNGLKIKIASDKYTKAIFGYSVMSFYISIILVIANYFRFLFQGSANTIVLNDIPFADPVLSLCNGVYKARYDGDTEQEERLFWLIIDLLRSPDEIKSLTGSYLEARIQTKKNQQKNKQGQQKNSIIPVQVVSFEDIQKQKSEKEKKND